LCAIDERARTLCSGASFSVDAVYEGAFEVEGD
jgi:hypothetical protein